MRELLFSITKKDFELQTFCSGGHGGQHQNKTESGIRIIHHASGARGESREYKSQAQNRKAAFKRLVNTKTFQKWLKLEVAKRSGELAIVEARIKKWVDSQMADEFIKIEYL
ncbi:peptide chain release factor-like protein [Candidatus Dojkabacteria bacterium]|jgi:protein subunit release factor B|nr:peptide chain release factor-like protein [Candidatus Dojkabacteria bacterium]